MPTPTPRPGGGGAALAGAGVRRFAVAYVAEAATVRAAAPEAELILVLGAAQAADVPHMLRERIVPVVVSSAHAQELSAAAVAAGARLPVHLKLDTGMGRLGFVCPAELDQAAAVVRLPGLDDQGVCTHFAMVDRSGKPTAARGQAEKITASPADARRRGRPARCFRHMSSSRAASAAVPDCDQDDRPASDLATNGYGSADPAQRFATVPVLTGKTRVLQVKTVPAGFAVGLLRQLSDAGADRSGDVELRLYRRLPAHSATRAMS
jgi:alanine racemase